MNREFPHETEVSDGTDQSALDTSSSPRIGARHSVDAPYRDRHDALVHRYRALARDHDEASRAAERRDRLARQLEVIGQQLRDEARPLLESLPTERRCRSRWQDMSGTDTCRRCSRCGHDVHDLALLTREEADALVARLGGTLRRRPDGRVVTGACPAERPGVLAHLGAAGLAGAVAAGAVAGGAMVAALAPIPVVHVQLERSRSGLATLPSPAPVRIEALRSDYGAARSGDAVRLLGPGTYEVDRARLPELVASIERSTRFVPDAYWGGLRVHGVRPGALAHALGVQEGDVILDVNGTPIAHPDQLLRAPSHPGNPDIFIVRLLRRGEERVLVYHVRTFV